VLTDVIVIRAYTAVDAVNKFLAGGGEVYGYIAKFAGHLPHRYGNSRAIWDHTVLPATRPLPQPKLVLD